MNINLKLSIPLIDENNNDSNLRINSSLYLYPFYATEEDIYSIFETIERKEVEYIRQTILNASINVDRLFKIIEMKKLLSESEIFSMKRDYVICTVTNTVAKKLNSDLSKKVSKSKTLGDFSVSTSYENDSVILSKIFSDSTKCIRELDALIKNAEAILIKPETFNKASKSITGYKAQPKLWWLNDLEMNGYKVNDGFASYYYFYNGQKYKAGSLNNLNRKSRSIYPSVLDEADYSINSTSEGDYEE